MENFITSFVGIMMRISINEHNVKIALRCNIQSRIMFNKKAQIEAHFNYFMEKVKL